MVIKKNKIETFIKEWFVHFDRLDDNQYFLKYLDKGIKMKFSETEKFTGHNGFNTWYNKTKGLFKGDTEHHVSNIQIREKQNNEFDVSLQVHLKATLKTKEQLDFKVTEHWSLIWIPSTNQPLIKTYNVKAN